MREPASDERLLWWLEQQLRDQNLDPEDLAAWLSGALGYLKTQRGFTTDELDYGVRCARRERRQPRLAQVDRLQRVFSTGRYAWDSQYNGFIALNRHFFPQIGNLKSSGEEFECAQFIANEMDGVRDWIRNVDRKPGSFSLPTSSDRFYPDFVIRLTNGGIIAAEYNLSSTLPPEDSDEKKRYGELWDVELRSGQAGDAKEAPCSQ